MMFDQSKYRRQELFLENKNIKGRMTKACASAVWSTGTAHLPQGGGTGRRRRVAGSEGAGVVLLRTLPRAPRPGRRRCCQRGAGTALVALGPRSWRRPCGGSVSARHGGQGYAGGLSQVFVSYTKLKL